MSQFEESDADIWRGIDEVKFLLCKDKLPYLHTKNYPVPNLSRAIVKQWTDYVIFLNLYTIIYY